jgi:hypothetical protein
VLLVPPNVGMVIVLMTAGIMDEPSRSVTLWTSASESGPEPTIWSEDPRVALRRSSRHIGAAIDTPAPQPEAVRPAADVPPVPECGGRHAGDQRDLGGGPQVLGLLLRPDDQQGMPARAIEQPSSICWSGGSETLPVGT